MPSPLNTPTGENIPISIFDAVVDIDLDETPKLASQVSNQVKQCNTFQQFKNDDEPSSVTSGITTFSLASSSSSTTSTTSLSHSSKFNLSPGHLVNNNRVPVNTYCSEATTTTINGSSSNDANKTLPNGKEPLAESNNIECNANNESAAAATARALKHELTLTFHSSEANKHNEEPFPFNKRLARLSLHLPVLNPIETIERSSSAQSSIAPIRSNDDGKSLSSPFSEGTTTSTSTTSTTTSSMAAQRITGNSTSPVPPPPLNLRLTIPITSPGSLALNDDGCGGGGGEGRRKRPIFNFLLNKALNPQDAVRVDTSIPLEQQDWFHGVINRVDAEMLLRSAKVGAYLVRKCDRRNKIYSLAVKSLRGFMHIRIFQNQENGRYTLGPTCDEYFDTIPQLVDHFTQNRLPISGAEHMSLVYPVMVQML